MELVIDFMKWKCHAIIFVCDATNFIKEMVKRRLSHFVHNSFCIRSAPALHAHTHIQWIRYFDLCTNVYCKRECNSSSSTSYYTLHDFEFHAVFATNEPKCEFRFDSIRQVIANKFIRSRIINKFLLKNEKFIYLVIKFRQVNGKIR